jgi:hypothetical protein
MEDKIDEARREFNALLEYLLGAALGFEIHKVEEEIFRRLLRLGRLLLELFVLGMGTGKQGQALKGPDGYSWRYAGTCTRRYLSIFGEITILRAHYVRNGRSGLFPLDARLNLPERKYSYVLQEWMSSEAVETSYEAAAARLNDRLGLQVAHRPVQRVVRDCADAAEKFMESLPPPPPEEEGSLLVHSVDCKGIPMRPADRNPDAVKTEEKPGEKKMACVARAYSIDPHERDPEVIVESFLKRSKVSGDQDKESPRPKPCHRRTTASLKRSKSEVFDQSEAGIKTRVHKGTKEKAVLMDGERVLWRISGERFPDWTEILDFSHVMEKLRFAGDLHFGQGSKDAEEYVRERALLLLEGEVDVVIDDLLWSLVDGCLTKGKAEQLKSKVVGYFQNNRHRMAYGAYLAKGLPIATGIVESTCKTLIQKRMEGAGMLWSPDGAEAVLKLRGIFLDDLWKEFWAFRAQREKKRLYAAYTGIRGSEPKNQQFKRAA